MIFHKREYAGQQLAKKLAGRTFRDPLVLAIPRGGIVTGAALAHELGAELDVVLSARLRDPVHPELKKQFRQVRAEARVAGRSVIVTDDGIATGSAILAALHLLRTQNPHELIVAVPVAPSDRLGEVRRLCDETICLHSPEEFWAIADFYADFSKIEDEQAVDLLRSVVSRSRIKARAAKSTGCPAPRTATVWIFIGSSSRGLA